MTRFIDEGLPDIIVGFPCTSSPRWSTDLQQVDSGAERANQRWIDPLYHFRLPDAVRDQEAFEVIRDHWLIMRGPLSTFPFKDPLDFASVALTQPNKAPVISATDQLVGTGDGLKFEFQLLKTYNVGSFSYTRQIFHPVVSTFLVAFDGVDPETLSPSFSSTINRLTGKIAFSEPPPPGVVITSGYLFDVEVRFTADDSFDGIVRTFGVSGYADIEFTEVRPCG